MLQIVLIRPGCTDFDEQGRIKGCLDIPLNDHGRAQARRNGETLRKLLPHPAEIDYVTSPLGRTQETMAIVRSVLGLPVEAVCRRCC